MQRSAEQAENTVQQTLFAVTGKRKKPKRYRILFLDADHAMASKLAEIALAESHPHAGRFGSAGLEPGTPSLRSCWPSAGAGASCCRPDDAPRSFDDALDVARHYHVVVGLGVDPSRHFEVPYRTAVLQWDLEDDGVTAETDADVLYRALMVRVRDLMTTLGVRDEE